MKLARVHHPISKLVSLLFTLFVFLAFAIPAAASGPVFATLPPASGVVGGSFFVFFPFTNTGTAPATSIKITTVTFGAAVLHSPALPLPLNDLPPGGVDQAVFTFDGATLLVGKNYLLTVRGTYQAGGSVLGFALNRILTFGSPTVFQRPANPLSVGPTLDSGHAVTQFISAAAGGTVIATGMDGSVFTLMVPAKALLSDENITMTPISAITGLPISGGLLAAVQLAPEGLVFQNPATLTIQPVTPVLIPQQVGFGYHGGGAEFHYQPIALAQAITFSILHFSGVGVGQGTPGPDGTPTRALDRLDNAETPLLALERQALFPNDPPPSQQNQATSEGLLQQYYEQSLQPELQAAESNDALASDAVESVIAFNQEVQNLGAGNSGTFQADSTFIQIAVPIIVSNAYSTVLGRCESETSAGARMLQAEKLQWLFNAPQAVGAGGAAQFPNYNADLTSCLAAPLELDYDTFLQGSGIVVNNVSLILNANVKTPSPISMSFSSGNMAYNGSGFLDYASLVATVTYPPPTIDCGTNLVGNSGTISASGKFDLNFDPSTITNISQIPITLTVDPNVSELGTFAAFVSPAPCTVITIPLQLYNLSYILGDGLGPQSTAGFAPFLVMPDGVPQPINLHATFGDGGGLIISNITGTITLTPQN